MYSNQSGFLHRIKTRSILLWNYCHRGQFIHNICCVRNYNSSDLTVIFTHHFPSTFLTKKYSKWQISIKGERKALAWLYNPADMIAGSLRSGWKLRLPCDLHSSAGSTLLWSLTRFIGLRLIACSLPGKASSICGLVLPHHWWIFLPFST